MQVELRDGTGSGRGVHVTAENYLAVAALDVPMVHHVAANHGEAYTVEGSVTVNNATFVLLHLQNTSETKTIIVHKVRAQLLDDAGGTAVPAAATSFSVGHSTTYSSGGTAVTPGNTNAGSSRAAEATVYHNGPTVAGTFVSLKTWRPSAEAAEVRWDDEYFVVPPNKTFSVRLTTDRTSGTAYASISFVAIDTVLE